MAFAKHKQFAQDVGTIVREGVKVGGLKRKIATRQKAVVSKRGTSGSKANFSAPAASALAENASMFNAPARPKKPSSSGHR